MFKALVKVILIVLALLGATKLFELITARYSAEQKWSKNAEVASPNGKLKAIKFNRAGGGGIAPFCFDRITVVDSSADDTKAGEDRFEVYEAACTDFSDQQKAPVIAWDDDAHLKITASLYHAAANPMGLKIKGMDASKSVNIELAAHR